MRRITSVTSPSRARPLLPSKPISTSSASSSSTRRFSSARPLRGMITPLARPDDVGPDRAVDVARGDGRRWRPCGASRRARRPRRRRRSGCNASRRRTRRRSCARSSPRARRRGGARAARSGNSGSARILLGRRRRRARNASDRSGARGRSSAVACERDELVGQLAHDVVELARGDRERAGLRHLRRCELRMPTSRSVAAMIERPSRRPCCASRRTFARIGIELRFSTMAWIRPSASLELGLRDRELHRFTSSSWRVISDEWRW